MRYIKEMIWQKIADSRLLTFAVFAMIITNIYNTPLKIFAKEMNYPSSIYTLPFLLAEHTYLILIIFGVIYSNADIPFMQSHHVYSMIRIGRRRWAFGQAVSIVFRSFIEVVILWICSVITLLPNIEIGLEWGKLIKTAGYGETAGIYGLYYRFYEETFIEFTPLQMMLLIVVIGTLVFSFLGLLMFLISLFTNRMCAVAASLGISFLMFWVLNAHPMIRYRIARFVPTVWMEVAKIYTPDLGYYWIPSITYMIGILIALLVIFIGFISIKAKNVEFDWKNEDL